MSFKALDLPEQVRGDTWEFTILFQESNGSPRDITSNQYTFTLKNNATQTDNNAALQVTPILPGVGDAPNGILNFSITPDLTEDLTPANFYYDLQEITQAGEVSTVLLGRVKVRRDITITSSYVGAPEIDLVSSSGILLYTGRTTTTDPTSIFLDGINGVLYEIKENSTFAFSALLVGKDLVTLEACSFKFEGALERDTGNSTKIIGTIGKTVFGKENAAFDAYVEVPVGTDNLAIQVVPASTNQTDWSARLTYTEVFN